MSYMLELTYLISYSQRQVFLLLFQLIITTTVEVQVLIVRQGLEVQVDNRVKEVNLALRVHRGFRCKMIPRDLLYKITKA